MVSPKSITRFFIVLLCFGILSLVSCDEKEDLFVNILAKPNIPQNLVITEITDTSLVVNWMPLEANVAVKDYLVYQDNVQVALDSSTTYKATGLDSNSEYTFSVRAINSVDNISDFSSVVSARTMGEEEMNLEKDRILIFTKTAGFRHESIEKGVSTFLAFGVQNDFEVDQTENSTDFNSENLNQYNAVVFLNTTGDILNESQQAEFEEYIRAGGSYMGVHAATDTEYDWPWYGQLVGAYFNGHPAIQQANITILDADHQATQHLENTWSRTDEWYNYKDINIDIDVLLMLDESSYEGGSNGTNHPIAWYHQFDGGRSFYTGGGHSEAAYDELDFQKHLLGGLFYCLKR